MIFGTREGKIAHTTIKDVRPSITVSFPLPLIVLELFSADDSKRGLLLRLNKPLSRPSTGPGVCDEVDEGKGKAGDAGTFSELGVNKEMGVREVEPVPFAEREGDGWERSLLSALRLLVPATAVESAV